MSDIIITINPGSATIKLGVFACERGEARSLGRATVDEAAETLRLKIDQSCSEHHLPSGAPASAMLKQALDHLGDKLPIRTPGAIAQRVVHGGDQFPGPVIIDRSVLDQIESLIPLAPLHQPKSVALIRIARELYPDVTQIACFDTSFHRTQPDLVRRYAIPRALFDAGVKRFGFHGLSYQFITRELERRRPQLARGRVVVAHLGAGASLCALDGGVSRDTSMGFSTLDGVPMATRCGAIDPGVLLHLMNVLGMSTEALEDMLYHRSGLLGLSGVSGDARVLVQSEAPAAGEALDIFAFRVAREAAALAATLGGIDALVFTGGIGEHQPEIRANVCARLRWLGVTIDAQLNTANAPDIALSGARVAALIISADEEQAMAEECSAFLASA